LSVLTGLALLVGFFVAAPTFAHYLRRRTAGEQVLPTARLLSKTPPAARKRSALEDRLLYLTRVIAIVSLAILGATPFVRCSHLSLSRPDGASIAIAFVIDDSLSMRAPHNAQTTRFESTRKAALDLLASAAPGDSFAIVFAGAPPRVELSPTSDQGIVKSALEKMSVSDRATDLDGAISIAADLVRSLPHVDKRVALLSDLADGTRATTLPDTGEVKVWFPLPSLTAKSEADCAIVRAERHPADVRVTIACTPGTSARGRKLSLLSGERVVSDTTLTDALSVVLPVSVDLGDPLDVLLDPKDTIASNDRAAVSRASRDLALLIVSDAADHVIETGGPPPVEQALAALELASIAKPSVTIPEHNEELDGYAGILVDDPPGFTPEQRRALEAWVNRGGELFLTLGPHAGSASLGASFSGLVPGVVRYETSPVKGANPATCGFFGLAREGLSDFAAAKRATLDPTAVDGADLLCSFSDGAPLFLRRRLGRGSIHLLTVPFSLDASDFVLRPAFLSALDRFAEEARARAGAQTVEAGQSFGVAGIAKVRAMYAPFDRTAEIPLDVHEDRGLARVRTDLAGRYLLTLDDKSEVRVALVPPREIDLRPRALPDQASDKAFGGEADKVDISRYVALFLLFVVASELVIRVIMRRTEPAVDGGSGDASATS
jgi:hypothetical protein